MGFLIAEVLGLLALAAIAGGAFVYWWVRRRFVDVSSEYETYRHQLADFDLLRRAKSAADSRIAELEASNEQIQVRLGDELEWRATLQETLKGLAPVSLDPVTKQLDTLRSAVEKIPPTDLGPVESQLGDLTETVGKLSNADLSGIEAKMSAVATAVAATEAADLDPVERRLDEIDGRLIGLRSADLAGFGRKLSSLEDKIAKLRNADLTGVHTRLDTLEKTMRNTSKAPLAKPTTTRAKRVPSGATRRARGMVLKSPSHGQPDDLKRISGVGPVLERMLNRMGIYYYWQVSDWQKADVTFMDNQVGSFKGRIERDDWVQQAKTLAESQAASGAPTVTA